MFQNRYNNDDMIVAVKLGCGYRSYEKVIPGFNVGMQKYPRTLKNPLSSAKTLKLIGWPNGIWECGIQKYHSEYLGYWIGKMR